MPEITCLGILVADVIARPVRELPAPGELTLVPEMRPCIGGCAANTGIGLQKLGVPTAVVGQVGRDGFGDFILSELRREGIEGTERSVSRDAQAPTSATMVMVAPDAERAFLHCVGANATFTANDVPWDVVEGSRLLHIAGHFLMPRFDGAPCAQVLARARRSGLKTSLDTAGSPSREWACVLKPLLPHLDYFVPSLAEARLCVPDCVGGTPQEIARYFVEEGVGVVALKMGSAGSYVLAAGGEWQVPPFAVDAIDATGAGDAFAAGFLAGALRGLELPECARLGNAVGALCTTAVGTTAGLRSLDETLQFMRAQPL